MHKINPKVSIIGAIDRLNYGDLLFPHIIEKKICDESGSDYNFEYYGLVTSSLARYGAKPTKNLRTFYTEADWSDSVVILAGGESLSAGYARLLSFIDPRFAFLSKSYKLGKFVDFEMVAKTILGGKTKYPFVIPKECFRNNVKIIYNSPGASGLQRSPAEIMSKIIEGVNSSDYFSVRDRATYEVFKKYNFNNVCLSPDSAILVSSLFPRDLLRSNCSCDFLTKLENIGEGFVSFQVGKYKCGENIGAVIDEISNLHRSIKMPIALCPIGTAPGHEDHVPLELINTRIPHITHFFNDLTMWETMYLIASSSLYVGTSLHGIITSMSFGIPYAAINEKITKIKAYLETWSHPDLAEVYSLDNFCKGAVSNMFVNKSEIIELTERQKSISNSSFKRMCNIIHS